MGSLKRFFSSDFSGFLSASGVEGDTGAAAKGGVGAGAKAGGAREDQQEREEGGGETLGVQGGWW